MTSIGKYFGTNTALIGIVLIFSGLSVNVFGQGFDEGFSGLEAWYRADATEIDNGVFTWYDMSPNNRHASQSVAVEQPTISTSPFLNDREIVVFDGVNDYLIYPGSMVIGSMIVVMNFDDVQFPDFNGLFTALNGTIAGNLIISSSGTTNLNSSYFGNTNWQINFTPTANFGPLVQHKMVFVQRGTPTYGTFTDIRIGRDRTFVNRSWKGDVAEIIVFDHILTIEELDEVRTYLLERYSPQIQLEEYILNEGFCDFELNAGDGFLDYSWSNGGEESVEVFDEAGIYSLSVSNTFNVEEFFEFELAYPGNFIEPFILCSGQDSIWNLELNPEDFDFVWQDGSDNASFTIDTAGFYSVTVTDGEGCEFESEVVSVELDGFPATQVFTSDVVELCSGGLLNTTVSEMENLSFTWSTGTSTPSIPVTEPGVYSVEVVNENGCEANGIVDVVVSGISPVASFSYDLDCETLNILFFDESIQQDDSPIVEWYWEIDGIAVSNEQNPVIELVESGIYNVVLKSVTASGCEGQFEEEIVVPSSVISELVVSNNCVGSVVSIDDQSSIEFAVINEIEWIVTDLTTGNNVFTGSGQSVTFEMPSEGLYSVERSFTTSFGCTESIVSIIEGRPTPFCFDPSSIASLNLWLSSDSGVTVDDASQTVSLWGNRASEFNDAMAVNTSYRPAYIPSEPVLNDKPALRFDGVSNHMDFGELTNIRTAFFLFKHRTGFQDQFSPLMGHPTLTTFGTAAGSIIFSNSTSPAVLNGIARFNGVEAPAASLQRSAQYGFLSVVTTDSIALQTITKDRNFTNRVWDGDYVEILFFSDSLSNEEVLEIEQYLRYKYAPPVNLSNEIHVPYGFCGLEINAHKAYFTDYQWSTGSTDSTITVDQPGVYSVTVTDIYGFSSTDSVSVVFPGAFMSEDVVICEGDSLVYDTELSQTLYTFNWSTGDSTSSVSIYQEGLLTLTVIDTNECIFNTTPVSVFVDPFPTELAIDLPAFFCEGNMLSVDGVSSQIESILWSTGSSFQSIVPVEEGDYWVQAQNVNGCAGSDTVSVEFSGIAPETIFSLSQFCEQTELIISNESTTLDGSEIISAEWLVNGALLEGDEVTFTFPEFGNYLVELNVLTNANCTGQYRDSVTIHPIPQIDFNYSLPCSGQPVIFEDSSSIALGSLASWFWDFGDGNTANTSNTLFTFSSPGVGEVSLTVTSDEGCASVFEAEVPVNPTPQASFVWENTCQGSPMPFQSTTDTSLTGSLNYAWNFDGVVAGGAGVQHLFPNPGSFLVTHEVWTTINNSPGCFGQQSQVVTVSSHPVLDFEHTIACAGDPFTITDFTTTGQIDSIVGRQWIVNGEVINESAEFTYTFPEPGDYNIVLAIQTEAGCSGQLSQTIPVGSTVPPGFTVSPEVGAPPAQVQFVNSGSYGAHHIWDFGDGNTSLEIDPIHTYQDTGIFYPQLTVIDEAGCPGIADGEFYAFEPYFDVSIEAVNCTDDNGQITVSGVLGNYNNHRLTSAELRMWLGNGTVVSEMWEGSVERNQLASFTFTSRLNFRDDIHAEYLCVEIANPNGNNPDAVPANNKRCKSISTSMFALFPPFPNPADNEIQQFFHLGQSGEVHFRLVQTDGKVIEERRVKRSSGLHNERFQTASLATGIYVLWAEFRGETTFHRVQIIR